MDFRSFMMQEIDGEFNFLPKGCIDDNQGSPSSKYVNNKAPVIDANPLTSLHPLNFVKDVVDSDDASAEDNENPLLDIVDSDDASAGDNENPLLGTSMPPLPESVSKVAGEASDPLDVDSDADIHAYMRQVILDNVLNSRTQKLISALHKAAVSYDAIRARELEKDRAYLSWRGSEMDALKQDRASVVAKVVSDAATKLIRSDEMVMLVAKLVKASIKYGRCAAFEEVAKLKEPFVMEKMACYRPSLKQEYNQAGDDLANASYPFFV
ncbi:hypothetical protein Tco_0916405 [Tanacetum coccineum]